MKMHAAILALTTAAATVAGGGVARADDAVVVKLGTMAPNGSPWHTLLKEMGQKWSEASGGKVTLRIYAGGVVGNEGDMVKKTRVGQLQAAALTTIGLHEITPEPQAMDVPMMVQSFAMLDYVQERMAKQLDEALEKKGYIVLNWAEVGFVRFFNSKPYKSLGDMRQAKVFAWEGDPSSVEAWKAGGFRPVVISSTDIVPSLQTGMIDSVALAPLYAFSSRIFERAKYMLDLPWAVLTGATVVKKDTWEKIPADTRAKLLAISLEYGKKINVEVRRMDSEALETMKKQGLTVIKTEDVAAFSKAAEAGYSVLRSKTVPAATFDQVKKLVDEARAKGIK